MHVWRQVSRIQFTTKDFLSKVGFGELEAHSPQILEMGNTSGGVDFPIWMFLIWDRDREALGGLALTHLQNFEESQTLSINLGS